MKGLLLNTEVKFYNYSSHENAIFSILIPSWNNYEHLKLLINSVLKNSYHNHQICVHLNEACEKSKIFLEKSKISHSVSDENIGVCFGFNAASSLAECKYIVLIDDDMYVAPDWDKYLYDEIRKRKDAYWCLSGSNNKVA